MAYKCRAYPDEAQRQMLARTFGCVRVVWNRTLADRHARYATEGKSTSYAQTDAALTAMKKTPELEWLNEVSSVPLQQALRHQHQAFSAFFAKTCRQDVLSGINVPVVPGAAGRALPRPRAQAQLREQVPARHAGLAGGVPAVDHDQVPPGPLRLVLQLAPEFAPPAVGDGLGQLPVAIRRL